MRAVKGAGGYRSRRYVFREFDALRVVDALLSGNAWQKIAQRPADPQQGIPRLVKWELLPGLRASYYEEEALGASYVVLTSTLGAPSVHSAAAGFEVHPQVYDFADLIAELDTASTAERRAVAVARAGLGAPLARDDVFFERISGCAADAEPQVRHGALWAVSLTEWPEFRDLLRSVARADADPELRELARETLTDFDELDREDR
ncbi:hypothetical protein [Streptomyces sp. NPDC016845]|uniref:hypothetical protein n=1 Tax=Streptomyces sp. NPDC016845 TaxID=3364972 RepID=UPI0037A32814